MRQWRHISFDKEQLKKNTKTYNFIVLPATSRYPEYGVMVPPKMVTWPKNKSPYFYFTDQFEFSLRPAEYGVKLPVLLIKGSELIKAWGPEALQEEKVKPQEDAKPSVTLPKGRFAAAEVSIADLLAADSIDQSILWYDWLCPDSEIFVKGEKLLKALREIADTDRFDSKNTCVFFRNLRMETGIPFDAMTICDKTTGRALFFITQRNGSREYGARAQVWIIREEEQELAVDSSWNDVKLWFAKETSSEN